jgi:hypothetical protein
MEMTRRKLVQLAAGMSAGAGLGRAQIVRGGAAEFRTQGSTLTLGNPHVSMSWRLADGRLAAVEMTDLHTAQKMALGPNVFRLELAGGRVLRSSEMAMTQKPKAARLAGDPRSIQRAGQRQGRELTAAFRDAETGAVLTWRAMVLDDSRYVRQELTIAAGSQDFPLREIILWDFDAAAARAVGTVKGSPVVAGTFFLGFEHPLSLTSVASPHVRCSLPRQLPVRAGQSLACSSVIGTTPEGQLRRGFLEYVEDQRAHPFRTFLHYNSWYDLGYFNHYDEPGVLDRIKAFGTELKVKRGAVLDSFMFDDGWDDPSSLWNFHSGFPNGFTNAAKAAAAYGAGIGVWLRAGIRDCAGRICAFGPEVLRTLSRCLPPHDYRLQGQPIQD